MSLLNGRQCLIASGLDFEISLNDVPSGRVNGRSRRAILTPLDPNQEYRWVLSCIFFFTSCLYRLPIL